MSRTAQHSPQLAVALLCALAAPSAADPAPTPAPVLTAAVAPTGPRPRKIIIEPPAPIPDAAALRQAEEENFDPEGPRHGISLGAFFMGWQQIGTVDDSGRGGGVGLRLGTAASYDTQIWLELVGGAFPNNEADQCATSRDREGCLSYIESSFALAATAQRYLKPNLWLRGGGGLATYTQVVRVGVDEIEERKARAGLAVLAGGGVDVVRFRSSRLSLETILALHRFSSGWIFDMGFGLGITYY
jgi:hypothetical protein